MKKDKILFCDIDGTLIDSFDGIKELSKKSIYAFKELKKSFYVIFTSGRSMCMLPQSILEIEADGYIMSSGAYVELNGKVLQNRVFNKKEVCDVIKITKQTNNFLILVGQKNIFCEDFNDNFVKDYLNGLGIIHTISNRFDFEKCNFMIELCKTNDSCCKVQELLIPNYSVNRQYKTNALDINLIDNNKGLGVCKVLNNLKIQYENTYCFGDSDNDISMMEQVCHSFAMGNANENIKKIASLTTDTVQNDGFYLGLVNANLINPLY